MSSAAFLAGAQVDPVVAHLHAFLALIPLGLLNRGDRADVSTALTRHETLYKSKHVRIEKQRSMSHERLGILIQ